MSNVDRIKDKELHMEILLDILNIQKNIQKMEFSKESFDKYFNYLSLYEKYIQNLRNTIYIENITKIKDEDILNIKKKIKKNIINYNNQKLHNIQYSKYLEYMQFIHFLQDKIAQIPDVYAKNIQSYYYHLQLLQTIIKETKESLFPFMSRKKETLTFNI